MSKSTKFYGRLYAFQFLYRGMTLIDPNSDELRSAITEFENSLETILEEQDLKGKMIQASRELGKILIENFIRENEAVQTEVSGFIHRNNFENLTNVEKTLLKLGYYELKFTKDSYSEIINDYVNLAKTYGKKDSYSIVNGVLDSAKKSL